MGGLVPGGLVPGTAESYVAREQGRRRESEEREGESDWEGGRAVAGGELQSTSGRAGGREGTTEVRWRWCKGARLRGDEGARR